MQLITYQAQFRESLIELILNIQVNEFNIKISRAEQPDLEIIDQFYQRNNGNFWLIVDDKQQVVATLGLIDIGNNQVALRKMFVRADYRGKEYNLAQNLLDNALHWCQEHNIDNIYLGTTTAYLRAHRFYERNKFQKIAKQALPPQFPLVHVDNVFYWRKV